MQTDVQKLGPQQREHEWIDAKGETWRWTDATAWQCKDGDRWVGSYWTVEGSPPFRRV